MIHVQMYVRVYVCTLTLQGGLVAQALFGVEDFNSSWVSTIITLASPLKRPVVSFDHSLHLFYENVHKVS